MNEMRIRAALEHNFLDLLYLNDFVDVIRWFQGWRANAYPDRKHFFLGIFAERVFDDATWREQCS
jgi:hypothetical protein